MSEPTQQYVEFPPERFMQDLDRCEHGRHMKDPCWHCPDGNMGNPRMNGEDRRLATGEPILAYGLGGMTCYVLVKPEDHLPGTYAVRMVILYEAEAVHPVD